MAGRKPRAPNSMTLKKDEMSQDFYDDLIARIRTHCQQTALIMSGFLLVLLVFISWLSLVSSCISSSILA